MPTNQPLRVEVNQQDLYNVRTLLHGLTDAVPKITRMAVNKTLAGVRTDATNEVSKVITPTKTKIRKTINLHKITAGNATGKVVCKGKPLNLYAFKARKTKKGVTIQVLKSEPRSLIKHAFITKIKNNLVAIRRYGGKYGGSRRPWKKKGGNYKWYGTLPKDYRFPNEHLKFLTTLSIPEVLGHPPTIRSVLDLAGPRLKKQMDAALNYEISKLK